MHIIIFALMPPELVVIARVRLLVDCAGPE